MEKISENNNLVSKKVNNKKEKIYSITGIKMIALFLVFIWHINIVKTPDLGARACEILFICSGFCMAYNYYDKNFFGTIFEGIYFLKKRIKKFYILYLITMIVAMIFLVKYKGYILNKSFIIIGAFNVLLIQTWCTSTFNGASWFLGTLMFCYFCTPFILSIIRKNDNYKKMIILFLGIFSIRMILEYIRLNFPGILSFSLHTFPLIRMLEYFLACIVGVLFLKFRDNIENSKNVKVIFSICELLVLTIYIFLVVKYNKIWYRGFFSFLGIIMIFIFSFQKGIISKILGCKVIQEISKYEMEFFLIHQIVINFISLKIQSKVEILIFSFILTSILSFTYKKVYIFISDRINAKIESRRSQN